MRAKHVTIAALALIVIAGGCKVRVGRFEDSKAAADAELQRVRARYNAQQFDALYDGADPALRSAVDRATFRKQAATTFSKYDPVTSWTEKMAGCTGVDVRYIFHSKFGQTPATEFYVMTIRDGKAAVASYEVVDGFAELPDSNPRPCHETS